MNQPIKPVPFESPSAAALCPNRDKRTRFVAFRGGYLTRKGSALVDAAGNLFGVRVFCSRYDREAEEGRFHLKLVELPSA